MPTLSTVNVKITGDTGQLVSSLTVAEKRVTAFSSNIARIGTTEARGFSNLARGFTNAAGQSGVLNSEISILASSVGNVGLVAAGAGIGFGALVGGLGASIAASVGFETAITKVAKTANFTAAETKAFGDEILSMSTRLPVATSALTDIAVVAGQLGIQGTHNIATFVEEVAKLSSTTGVESSTLATSLGTLIQVSNLPIGAVHNISAAITQLGNTSNSTEQQILDFSTRIVGVSSALGVPIADLLGISSAFAAAGVDAERGGTAIQRVLIAIDTAAQKGGNELQLFADVAGTTVDEFKNLVATDPGIAFARFVEGLKGVDNVIPVLDALGIADSRLVAATLSVANSNASVSKSIYDSRAAAIDATATNTEFARSADTTAAKFQIFKNNIHATAIEIGDVFNPAVAGALDALNGFFEADGGFDQLKTNIVSLSGVIVDVGTDAKTAYAIIAAVPGVGPIVALTGAFVDLSGALDRISGSDWGAAIIGAIGAVVPAIGVLNAATQDWSGSGGGSGIRGPFGELPMPPAPGPGVGDRSDTVDLRNLLQMNPTTAPAPKRTVDTSAFDKVPTGGAHALTALEAAMDGVITRTEALTLGLSDEQVIALELAVAGNKAADADYRRRIGLETLAQVFPGLTSQEVQFRLGLAAIADYFDRVGEAQGRLDLSTASLDKFVSAFDAIFNKSTKESAQLQLQLDQAKRKKLLNVGGSDASNKAIDAEIKRIQDLIDVRRNALDIEKDRQAIADAGNFSDQAQIAQLELLTAATANERGIVDENAAAVFLQTMAQMGLTGRVLEATTAVANFTDVLNNSAAMPPLSLSDALVALSQLPDHGASLLPSFSSGIASVPRDMTARIHRGERITPAGESGISTPFITNIYITADSEASDATARKIAKMAAEEAETALRKASFRGSYVTSGAYTPS